LLPPLFGRNAKMFGKISENIKRNRRKRNKKPWHSLWLKTFFFQKLIGDFLQKKSVIEQFY